MNITPTTLKNYMAIITLLESLKTRNLIKEYYLSEPNTIDLYGGDVNEFHIVNEGFNLCLTQPGTSKSDPPQERFECARNLKTLYFLVLGIEAQLTDVPQMIWDYNYILP